MINTKDFRDEDLKRYWLSGYEDGKGLPSEHLKRIRLVLTHIDTACNLKDIAEGLGRRKRFHKLKGHDRRYSLDVSGNYRITFCVPDPDIGVVKAIDYEDTH